MSKSPSVVNRILTGERVLKADEVPIIARYLGVQPDERDMMVDLSAAELDPEAIRVAEIDVRVAAGGGAVVEREDPSTTWAMPKPWVRSLTQAPARELHIVTIEGDSMEPIFQPGDKVIVDSSRRAPSPPGMFVLHNGLGLVVKQIETVPNTDPISLEIKSANPRYRSDHATIEEVNIVGRVIGIVRRI